MAGSVGNDQLASQLADIQKTLGRLVADSDRAVEDRRMVAREFAWLRQRVDELREVEATATKALAQAQATHKLLIDEVKPHTDEFKRLRAMGGGFLLAVALVGTLLGVTFSDVLRAAFAGVRRLFSG